MCLCGCEWPACIHMVPWVWNQCSAWPPTPYHTPPPPMKSSVSASSPCRQTRWPSLLRCVSQLTDYATHNSIQRLIIKLGGKQTNEENSRRTYKSLSFTQVWHIEIFSQYMPMTKFPSLLWQALKTTVWEWNPYWQYKPDPLSLCNHPERSTAPSLRVIHCSHPLLGLKPSWVTLCNHNNQQPPTKSNLFLIPRQR